jgi:cell volume regulation protein A
MGLKAAPRLRRFQSGMTWLAQMGMFLTLGLLATPAQFPSVAAPALALAFLLMFVARPVAAWVCLAPFGFTRNEITFVAWVGLRGAVSILLAILPSLGGLPNAGLFFNVVFLMVLASLVLQGWTLGAAARWLGMVVPPRRGPLERVDLELPDDADQELVAYRVHPDCAVLKGERMPRWARPALIIRAGHALTLHTAGPLRPDDHVYLFTAPQRLPLLDRLFAGRAGIEDREFYGDFPLSASALLGDVAQLYGFEVPEDKAGLSVGELLTRDYGGRAETGDRLTVGPVELIVRALDAEGRVQEVGLAVEPTKPAQPRLPLFQGRRDIKAWLARLRPSRRPRADANQG